MALNPVAYTEHVVRSFLRYQLTAYPFADTRLHAQMRELLSLDETRRSPLLKGPYVSLSRPFRQGAAIEALIREGLLHPHLRERIPESLSHLYGHQERAVRQPRILLTNVKQLELLLTRQHDIELFAGARLDSWCSTRRIRSRARWGRRRPVSFDVCARSATPTRPAGRASRRRRPSSIGAIRRSGAASRRGSSASRPTP